VACA